MSERELPAPAGAQSPPTRYYCPHCDARPGGYARPWSARKHIGMMHPVKYAELVDRWGDKNRINRFIKTAYDTPRGEPADDGGLELVGSKSRETPNSDEAGPGMAPGGETNLGVETPLKPNPGELDLAGRLLPQEQLTVDVAAILETQELMREALNQAIGQLNVHSQSLSEIMGGTPAKTQIAPVAATGWSFDWKSIPKEWNDPIWKFMGDIGAALRTIAGGAPADDDYGKMIGDELKRREKERMASRAKLIVDTIYGDEELYSKPKDSPKPEDVKKLG